MLPTEKPMTGGCLCGATRYEATGAPSAPHACHCDDCLRFSGSSFVGVEFDALNVSGPVRWFQSSDWAERGSCGTFGSAMFWRLRDGSVGPTATLGSLDDPSGLTPINKHYFADNRPTALDDDPEVERLSRAETMALFSGEDG